MPGETAFLGVERSLTGLRWRARETDDRGALAIAQRLGAPEIVGRILAARGVAADQAERYLAPTLRDLLPDPDRLLDMDAAATRLAAAIENEEPVCVFGDYDVDGATSSALLERFFAAAGAPLRVYIPDRRAEGYGPNAPALERLAAEGIKLVVTVDCGIAAFDALEAAAQAGLEVIVVDHHKAEARLPRAVAVVNPNRLDEAAGLGELAAVGVVFLLVVALNRKLRAAGRYKDRPEPDLLQWLDLVALGTVCDVAPLVGLNRAFVAQGLKIMARRGNPGIAALADVAGIDAPPAAYHLGFIIGPRVNAGGRVGEAGLGARLLATGEAGEAGSLAARLDDYNRERQGIEQQVLDEALAQFEAEAPGPAAIAAAQGWHEGVIGIVAARLMRRFNRPACVVAFDEAGAGKGSGRSVRGFDLGAAIIAARQSGLLTAGGGHAMAAGFAIAPGGLPAFAEFLAGRVARELGPAGGTRSLGIDGALTVRGANKDLLGYLDRAGPFGAGNAEPRFVLAGVRIDRANVVGDGKHVQVFLSDADGGRLKGIAFRAFESELGAALVAHSGRALHVAGHLRADNWQGREGVQLFVEDAAIID